MFSESTEINLKTDEMTAIQFSNRNKYQDNYREGRSYVGGAGDAAPPSSPPSQSANQIKVSKQFFPTSRHNTKLVNAYSAMPLMKKKIKQQGPILVVKPIKYNVIPNPGDNAGRCYTTVDYVVLKWPVST